MPSFFLSPSKNIYSFAFIGSGPGSMFLAKTILSHLKSECLIHFFEKEIYPYGLIRTGVAPDHPQYKNIQLSFDEIFSSPNCKYFGNTYIGKKLSIQELSTHYSSLIFGNGAQLSNELNIENENAPFIYNSRQIANWYNGALNNIHFQINDKSNNCVIIGNGNVAIDIARIFSTEQSVLKNYEFPQNVIEQFKTIFHVIDNIFIISRRGLEFSAFSTDQLRQLSKIKEISFFVNLDALTSLCKTSLNVKRKYSIVNTFQKIKYPFKPKSQNRKNIIFLFHYVPIKITQGKTNIITFKHRLNNLVLNINTSVIIKSLGFKNDYLFSKDVLYHNNHIKHKEGCVYTNSSSQTNNFFSVGWAKEGSKGTIQNTFLDSKETCNSMLSKINKGKIKPLNPKPSIFLSSVPGPIVSFEDWTRISNYEIANGKLIGKPREPIISKNKMLSLL